MNQLKEWGFSNQWWRGEKGEYWVIAQGLLSLGFILLPTHPDVGIEKLPSTLQLLRWSTIFFCGVTAFLMLFLGGLKLGQNLTPLPHPKPEGTLVTTGIYGLVRHPLYSGVIFAAIAYGCWQWSWVHGLGTIIFFVFFNLKANKEENWLQAKFPTYDLYKSKVKKLIPWIY
ncbi:MAG: isoprenylcysteine carboxylmethyltransferase family protein [Snowella sp.]|nr:isoprenylcysteine carboxylmethyltransferase family protein [Snowella sp.]